MRKSSSRPGRAPTRILGTGDEDEDDDDGDGDGINTDDIDNNDNYDDYNNYDKKQTNSQVNK